MFAWFNSISLRWKLTLVTVVACAMTMILASTTMGVYDARAYRAEAAGTGIAEAKVLADSISASLDFGDQDAALEYLNALGADPDIEAAAVYDATAKIFAQFSRVEAYTPPQTIRREGVAFQGKQMEVFAPVVKGKAAIGTVYIRHRVDALATRFAIYAAIVFGIGAAALALVLPISLRMHRVISNPLEELAARNAIIKTTLDSVDHGVIVADTDTHITFMNDRTRDILGSFLPDLRVGASFESLVQGWKTQDRSEELRRELELLRLRSDRGARDSYALPDGRTIEYRQSPLPQGGFVRTFTDISEEKALQEQLQSAKEKAEHAATAKSQFLAAMSHEIRTPMNGVIGIVELLRSTSLSSEQKQMVEIIRNSGISLLDVINDILDYSKIETGRMTVESTEFVLNEVIETTASVVGGHTSSKFIDIVCAVDPAIDHTVVGDPVRIRQIILNLMGNAVKFTQRGVVAIEVTLKSAGENSLEVLFEISDTGIGIPEEKQRQLFQPFTQADYSTTRKFGGTGLGLSISRNLIELMGGEVGVRSAPGLGSTFWFRVPFGRLPESRRDNPYEPVRSALYGLRVLVHDGIRPKSAAAIYLAAVGIPVVQSSDMAKTIELLRAEKAAGRPIDITIFSVPLGDDSVVRFAESVKRYRELADTRVILIVPHLSASSAKVAMTTTFAESVTAPIQRARLYEAVATVTERAPKQISASQELANLNFTPPPVEEAVSQGCLILVAEDNQTNQFVIKSQLRRLGYAAEFVNDGREAWQVLSRDESRYGLLITDCHMPFIDGYRLTGMIRDRELTSGRHLPVVALTANALQGESEICRAAGMDAYLFKPTNLPTLDAAVQKWLPKAAQLRAVTNDNGASPDTSPNPSPITPHDAQAVSPVTVATVKLSSATASPIHAAPVNAAPINLALLSQVIGNADPDALREIMAMYWESESEMPAQIRNLVDARDGPALMRAAHAAKGAAASVGAQDLTSLCKEMENHAALLDWPAAIALATKIDTAFGEIGGFIENAHRGAAE